MFEVKPHTVEKKESSTETDEGLGSSGKRCGSGSQGSGSLYLSDSQDWGLSPGCSPDEPLGRPPAVSPSLADETFHYMTYLALEPSSYPFPDSRSLSKAYLALEPSSYPFPDSRSLSKDHAQTRTYNDIEVVTHLLAERDRDLELAARIGQSLLQRNHLLQERNEAVEEQLTQAIDQVHQLQHELAKKDELLRMVASASEESESDSSCSAPHPLLHRPPGGGVSTTAAAALSQLEALQGKLEELEEENQALRSEATHLKTETVCYEEKEQRLLNDCVKELRESNSQVVSLADQLSHKGEEVLRHQEEISQLLSQIVELQHRVKELALEKEELRVHLLASKDVQRQLTCELNELTDRSAECVAMLHEAQEEVKEQRGKNSLTGGLRRHLSHGLYPMDSLAAEIEGTMRRELSVDEESAFRDQRTSQKRVFQTVRSVNTMAPRASSPALPGSGLSALVMTAQPFQSAQGEPPRRGQPGSPGGDQLTDAIHRLSLRRHNFLCERKFFQAERQRRAEALRRSGPEGEEGEEEGGASSGRSSYSNLSELSVVSGIFKTFLPEKLQIVKPMEGSLTLHHWQQLAKPHLATVLDPHPGVMTKAFCPLPQDLHLSSASAHRLDDLEEDEEERPGGWRCGPAEEEEKGSSERGKADKKDKGEEEEEEDEEEGGIVFQVRVSSTPEDRKERSTKELPEGRKELELPEDLKARSPVPGSPLAASRDPLSLFRPLAAVGASSLSSSSARAPLTSTASSPIQSQDQMVTSAAAAAILLSVQHPGKCLSSTFSTCTVTTCRILHPSDITQVTSSSQPMWSVGPPHTPSSMRTGPSTPVTPCRLSLGAGSSPLRRPATPLPAAGLAKLVLERGISASPRPAPTLRPRPLRPGTPPNSPSSAATEPRPPAAADNFLASRPAELFLQDVYGLNLGRAPPHPDLPSPAPDRPSPAPGTRPPQSGGVERPDPVSVGLVERLCRLGFGSVLQGPSSSNPTFVAAGGGSLLDGLRRNQSLPAMMGAGPGARRQPPTPPASLALPPPPWGVDAKQPHRRGRVSSFTQPSSSSSSSQSRKH